MRRIDGTIQSANLPAKGTLQAQVVNTDYGIYRCLVVQVYFTDDKNNLTFDNKQVTYDCLILGGKREGQLIVNVKNSNLLGGQYNYHERIYRKAIDPYSGKGKKRPQEQKGDIVYVTFVNGDTSLPIIIGCATHVLDKTTTGATKSDGSIYKQEYNGINESINKDGEYEFTRKGGTYNEKGHYFVPADRATEEQGGQSPEFEFLGKLKFVEKKIVIEDPKSNLTLDLENEKYTAEIGEKKTLLEIDGKQDTAQLKMSSGTLLKFEGESGIITIDADGGTNQIIIDKSGQITIKASTKVSVESPLVDVGENAAFSVTLFENLMQEFAIHTHNYTDDGSPSVTSPPVSPLISLVGSTSVKAKD